MINIDLHPGSVCGKRFLFAMLEFYQKGWRAWNMLVEPMFGLALSPRFVDDMSPNDISSLLRYPEKSVVAKVTILYMYIYI